MNQNMYDQYEMQSALQQQGVESQQMMNYPQLHEQIQQNQAVLVEQTNPKKVVREILLRLRGLEEKNDGTLIRVADPKINKYGKDHIWFVLDSHINQNIILSHLTDKEISRIMNQLSSDLVRDLDLNWRRYGIAYETDKDAINDSILVNIFLALKRAEGQNEKNWLGKISVENISNAMRVPMPKKDGFWNKFKL